MYLIDGCNPLIYKTLFRCETPLVRRRGALIQDTHANRLVGHISRDSTAIEAREKPATYDKPAPEPKPKHKRGRPRRGEIRPTPPPTRIERQLDMAQRRIPAAAMLADLTRACDVGAKRNAKGYQETWTGYKLHIDTADGEIPISCMLTAASVHDSQSLPPRRRGSPSRLPPSPPGGSPISMT
jgi:hypothetical protein